MTVVLLNLLRVSTFIHGVKKHRRASTAVVMARERALARSRSQGGGAMLRVRTLVTQRYYDVGGKVLLTIELRSSFGISSPCQRSGIALEAFQMVAIW